MQKYIGNQAQLFSFKNYILTDGKANNTRAIDIINGKGLFMTVLPDRCLDIYQLIYRDTNINYISPTGVVHPSYYDNRKLEFLRSFYAGFLTTCGLETICAPCSDDINGVEEELGLHGRISNTPADNFYARIEEGAGSEPDIIISGVMNQGRLFGDKYELTREIRISTCENKFEILDTVKNTGFKKSPHQILYHLNYGYPFLDENIQLDLPALETEPVDEHAARDLADWREFPPPQANMQEQCYYHKLQTDALGYARYSIYNPILKKRVTVKYDAKPLDYFIQWKMPGEGDYVLGLEPGNCKGGGRKQAREANILKYIEPQESIKYHLIIELSDD